MEREPANGAFDRFQPPSESNDATCARCRETFPTWFMTTPTLCAGCADREKAVVALADEVLGGGPDEPTRYGL